MPSQYRELSERGSPPGDTREVKGFAEFFARHTKALAIEREAVVALPSST